jgi:carbon-monoxide dehydrogenase medium subunit
MRRFELLEPRSIEEACQILAEHEEAKLIAGGTALLILIKQGIFIPATLVNLKKVKGASDFSYDATSGLRMGALASIFDVETAPSVRQHYPLLSQACHLVANIRIRNLATIGGNLAHADYQSDPPAVLIALGASVELTSRRGNRQVKLSEFLLGTYETVLEPGEVLTAVMVPASPQGMQGTYIKFTTRSSEDRPCAVVAAMARIVEGICEEARLVIGAVSPVPVRVSKAEEMARGEKFSSELIEEMSARAAELVEPIADLRGPADYKRQMVRVLSKRALAALTKGAQA